MFTRVTPKQFFYGRRPAFAPLREFRDQRLEPLCRLRVIERRMQPREAGMRQDLNRRKVSASSSSDCSPCARPTR